jgi:hypothetical protein
MARTELTRAFEAALKHAGLDVASCTRCGGLQRSSVTMLVINDGEVPAKCEACGLMLDAEGRAVGMRMLDGRIRSTLIVLAQSPVLAGELGDRGAD